MEGTVVCKSILAVFSVQVKIQFKWTCGIGGRITLIKNVACPLWFSQTSLFVNNYSVFCLEFLKIFRSFVTFTKICTTPRGL